MKAIERELWNLCRQLTFNKYGNTCYTCGATGLEAHNRQCGHAYPKGALGALLKYDLRILRPQCYHCNINLGGMGATFWKRLEAEIGKKEADAMYLECQQSKGKPVKARHHYNHLLVDYAARLRPDIVVY